MKTNTLKAVAAVGLSALFMGSAAAQSVSQPVGYETITINQQFNYMGLRLLGEVVASSTVATVDTTANTITLAGGSLDDGEFIVEVNDGDAIGAVVLGAVVGDVITLPSSVAGNLTVGDTVVVRAPQTLESVFGDPVDGITDPNLGISGAGGAGGADLVLVPNGDDSFTTYFYFTGGFGGTGAGWQELEIDGSTTPVDASAISLVYTDGVIVQNRGSDNEIVVSGSVKTTPTATALTSQFNYLSTVYPAGSTLSSVFDDPDNPGVIADGTISGAGGAGGADLVFVPNGATFDIYFYFTGGFGGTGAGWRQIDQASGVATSVDSTTVSLDTVTGIIIQNRGSLPQGITVTAPSFYADL